MKHRGFRVFWGIPGICALLLLLTGHLLAQFGGGDVNVDPSSATQNEISMALVPGTQAGNPQVLLAAYNYNARAPGSGVGVAYSIDGGAKWVPAQLGLPTSSISQQVLVDAFDPTATADTAGRLFVAHISSDGQLGGISGLYVHRSTDLGQTWPLVVEVSADPTSPVGQPDPNYRFNDRCQITADRVSSGNRRDNVYIAWIKDRGLYIQGDPNNPPLPNGAPPSDIYFAYSTDNGVSFSVPTPATINDNPGTDLANMPVPRVAADGTVYVSWLDYDVWTGGSGTIWLDKSTDGGVTWGADQKVATITLPPLNVTDGLGFPNALAKGAPVLATSPTNANELYMAYAADPGVPGDEADIFFIRSTNGGVNWSTPLRLHNDVTTTDQILPWMDVKANGLIDVAWYDRQNSLVLPPGDVIWDVFLATSVDGGLTFQPEAQLSDVSFATAGGGTWMGEYLGLVVDATHAYVTWTSSLSDPAGDVYFDKLANPVVSTPTQTATATPGQAPTATPVPTAICGTVPETGCGAAMQGKSRVVIKNHSTDTRDMFVWVWPRGDVSTLADFRDPVSGSATYRVCVYDSNAALTQPLMQMDVPPGGTCRGKPCWKATSSTGYRYRDPDLTNDGTKFVRLKTGVTGKAKVVVRGKGANLALPTLPLTTPVTVQLVIDDGPTRDCWQTTYSGTPIRNDSLLFKAKE